MGETHALARKRCRALTAIFSWSEAIAVGSLAFVDKVRSELGAKAMHREVVQLDGTYTLREESESYGRHFASENDALMTDNTILWEKNAESAET